jgi:hypothetical protein
VIFDDDNERDVVYPSSYCRLREGSPHRDNQECRRKIKHMADRGVLRQAAGARVEPEPEFPAVPAVGGVAGADEGGGGGDTGVGNSRDGRSEADADEAVANVGSAAAAAAAAAAAGAASLNESAGGRHWQWPPAGDAALLHSGTTPKKKQTKKQKVRKNATSYDRVYLRAAPHGAPSSALTSPTGWVAAKFGAVLAFADGTLMMMDECYEETGGPHLRSTL